jgi:hypothetical protein
MADLGEGNTLSATGGARTNSPRLLDAAAMK